MPPKPSSARIGVYLIGARGGLATTLLAGVELIKRKLVSKTGLTTESPLFAGVDLPRIEDLEFGGCDLRATSLFDSALEIYRDTGALPYDKLSAIKTELGAIDARIGRGTGVNCGAAIGRLARKPSGDRRTLRGIVKSLVVDLQSFRKERGVDRLVVVNLASTEPPLKPVPAHATLAGIDDLIDRDQRTKVRASTLYAYAAATAGAAFINFTPSDGALTAGVRELFIKRGLPFMGDDGKTGETLVKSALAPMFKYRNLRVLSWQGYNILGDRDGLVLSAAENKRSKVGTKDSVLSGILGYPLHTHVGIDYVPSLGDKKTAWDYVHFAGFLDYKMALTFTWHGCDSVLAAPLVLDMTRLAAVAVGRGEAGPMHHLACFFKRPVDVGEQDLHAPYHFLVEYAARLRKDGRRAKGSPTWKSVAESKAAPRKARRSRS